MPLPTSRLPISSGSFFLFSPAKAGDTKTRGTRRPKNAKAAVLFRGAAEWVGTVIGAVSPDTEYNPRGAPGSLRIIRTVTERGFVPVFGCRPQTAEHLELGV